MITGDTNILKVADVLEKYLKYNDFGLKASKEIVTNKKKSYQTHILDKKTNKLKYIVTWD